MAPSGGVLPSCSECNVKIKKDEGRIQCEGVCQKWYHTVCVDINDKENKMMLNLGHKVIWMCKNCVGWLTQAKLAASLDDRLKEISIDIKNVKSDIEQVNRNAVLTTKSNYAGAVQNKTPKVSKPANHNIIIRSKKKQTSKQTKETVKSKISLTGNKICVSNIREISNGGILLTCDTKEARDLLLNRLDEKINSEEYETKVTKLRKPTIKIVNITDEYSNATLVDEIKLKNPFLEYDEIEVRHIREIKSKKTWTAFIETAGEAFRKIMDQGKVYLNWDSCPVYEDISVLRCYNCQRYHHKGKQCTNDPVCSKCENAHNSRDCQEEIICCNNCKLLIKDNNVDNIDTNHEATSDECPVFKKHRDNAIKNINYE